MSQVIRGKPPQVALDGPKSRAVACGQTGQPLAALQSDRLRAEKRPKARTAGMQIGQSKRRRQLPGAMSNYCRLVARSKLTAQLGSAGWRAHEELKHAKQVWRHRVTPRVYSPSLAIQLSLSLSLSGPAPDLSGQTKATCLPVYKGPEGFKLVGQCVCGVAPAPRWA